MRTLDEDLFRAELILIIAEFARVVAGVIGYSGEITFDTSLPDGTTHKLLGVSRLAGLGWRVQTLLSEGVRRAYEAYLTSHHGRRV